MSVYGIKGFHLPLRSDDPITPRELFREAGASTYSPHQLWFVEPEVSVDDLYDADEEAGVYYTNAPELMPAAGSPRADGTRSSGDPAYLRATVEMLASGIVGYRYTADGLVPIRAHRRFVAPTGDRPRLRELLGESLGPT